jgi:hypothetical protein
MKHQWFVRLGTKFIGDLADPGSTKGSTPPRVTKEEIKNAITKMKMWQQKPKKKLIDLEKKTKKSQRKAKQRRRVHQSLMKMT